MSVYKFTGIIYNTHFGLMLVYCPISVEVKFVYHLGHTVYGGKHANVYVIYLLHHHDESGETVHRKPFWKLRSFAPGMFNQGLNLCLVQGTIRILVIMLQ